MQRYCGTRANCTIGLRRLSPGEEGPVAERLESFAYRSLRYNKKKTDAHNTRTRVLRDMPEDVVYEAEAWLHEWLKATWPKKQDTGAWSRLFKLCHLSSLYLQIVSLFLSLRGTS